MDIQQIRYFLALADELHFWNTAEKMHITQSALSRTIQSLENELGVQLFDRNKRNVKLTAAGLFLKENWKEEISRFDFIRQSAQQIHLGESGTIRISHPDSLSASVVPTILQNILNVFPKLQIELVQLLHDDQQESLKNYKIDFALARDINRDDAISSKIIQSDHLSLVLPADHACNTFEDITKETLSQEQFILTFKDQTSSYNDIIAQMFRSFDVIPEVRVRSEFGSTIIGLVKNGLGLAVLPDSYRQHEIPGIKFISLPFKSNIYLQWRTNDYNPLLTNVLQII